MSGEPERYYLVEAPKGLKSAEARRLLSEKGPNEIREEKPVSWVYLLLRQFLSPLVLVLLFACGLSVWLGEWGEVAAIVAILVLNAWIGFFQEYQAEKSILALKAMTAPRATVVRDGSPCLIPAREVVPGDLLLLEAGDVVAADGELVTAAGLLVNEAVLTGESEPVEKRAGTVCMGTVVARGTAAVAVQHTGMGTELGKIAHLMTTAQTPSTPMQEELRRLGNVLLALCLGIAACVLLLGWGRGWPWSELVLYSLSLAVAAVPEGMPAMVTVALALGVRRMADRNALIRSLASAEVLGRVSVICTDKTGTLTTGRMRVRELWGTDHVELLQAAVSVCDSELGPQGLEGAGDPTELAILLEAFERGIRREEIESTNPRVFSEPFDSARKRMSVQRQDGLVYVKGAWEALVPLCTPDPLLKKAESTALEMAARGLRVLAVAKGSAPVDASRLVLQGLIGIADPPRTEAREAIAEARAAGILPVMITGDHPATAVAIARELGLVLEGEETKGRVHARATPEEKLQVVREWKARGAVVAMTGDGVNDAPALREAHVGVAMGRGGTEVTRQAAQLILSDDNFATIVAAVREGRRIYQNIRRAVVFLLTGNFAEVLAVFVASVLGFPPLFLAAHLLWINLVTDSLPGIALVAEPASGELMKRPPQKLSESLLGKREWMRIVSMGFVEAAVVLAVFVFLRSGSESARAQGDIFTLLVFSQLWRSLGARSRTRIFWQAGVLDNLWLLGVVLITVFLQVSLHYIPFTQKMFNVMPFTGPSLLWVFLPSLVPVTLAELWKLRA